MNTQTDLPPDTAPFDLRLARDCGWPLRTRDGQKVRLGIWHAPGAWALAGYLESISDEICSWRKDGCYLGEEGSEFDLLLDLSDSPQYRAAVKRAHAAGWRLMPTEAQTPDTDALHAAFMAYNSMPTLDAYLDMLALARKLERERAILKTRIDATGKKEDSQ